MSNPKYRGTESFQRDRKKREMRKDKKGPNAYRDSGKRRRRQNWTDLLDEDPEVWEDYARPERIMPPGAHDDSPAPDAGPPGVPADESPAIDPMAGDDLAEGVVIEVSTGLCRVQLDHDMRLCTLRGSLSAAENGYSRPVAVGDQVLVVAADAENGVVEAILPRRNEIVRPDPSNPHLRQVLAANIDLLLIVASWRQPNVWPELIDRYVIEADRTGVTPVICLNKIDLAEDQNEVEQFAAVYRALDCPVILTSAVTGVGLDDLRETMRGKRSVLAGLSGVGKSSLLSAVEPGFALRTGSVNTDRGQGRHTTTQAIMLPFGADGWVIDTPGIREFGLTDLAQADLLAYYPDLMRFAGACRFADCTHSHEPGCAVREAVEGGAISAVRYHSYLNIMDALAG